MRTLVGLMQVDEWNQYLPFNGYLSTIKSGYDHIVGVVADNPRILLSEVDEYFTIENSRISIGYPDILDTSRRKDDDFIHRCVASVRGMFDDVTFASWQTTPYGGCVVGSEEFAGSVYEKSYRYAGEWLGAGNLIYPTQSAYDRMKSKYGHEFLKNENTFIMMTRNYKNKATCYNTNVVFKNLRGTVEYLTSHGIKIINIGFPPSPIDISSENYLEINVGLTQDELVALFYLSKGVLLSALAGGFISNFASNCDMFIMTTQFHETVHEVYNIIPKKTDKVSTIRLHSIMDSPDLVYQALKEFSPKRKLIFAEEKKVTYVN